MLLDRHRAEDPYAKLPSLPSFNLRSDDLVDGEQMPAKCAALGAVDGAQNLSPHLAWSGFPEETQSFVVSCFDPDAPTPSGFWHWTIADIPATVTSLKTGAGLPDGAVAIKSDLGTTDYAGPMPPEGDMSHRLFFVVHAVSVKSLGVNSEVAPVIVAFTLLGSAIARAQLVPTFER